MNAPAPDHTKTAAIAATIIALLLATGTVCAQTATPTAIVVDYDQTQIPADLEPGDRETVYFVISNAGGLSARDVRVSMSSLDALTVKANEKVKDEVSVGGFWELGTVNPLGNARFAGSLTVAGDARVGTHYLTMQIKYDESRYDAAGSLVTEEVTSKWLIPVEVTAGSLLELDGFAVNRQELRPGDNVDVSLRLANTGESDAIGIEANLGTSSSLDYTQLSLSTGGVSTTDQISAIMSYFTVLGMTKKKVPDIARGGSGTVDFTVHLDEDLPSMAYTLPFTVSYEDKSRTEHTDVYYIGVYVAGDRKLAITNFESDPAEIHADDEDVEFTGHIENQGTEQVKNVKVTFQPSHPLTNARSFVQTKEAGTIAGGSSTSFTFYADVADDIEPQATNVSFLLEYEVQGQPYTDEITYVVDILENPKFELFSEAAPTAPGQEGQAQVTVDNQGALCESVTLIVLEKSGQPFSFNEKSAYIGDLDRGESGVATIVYDVEEDAPAQPHLVPVEIRCTKDDDVLIYDKTVRLEVAEEGAGGSQTMLVAVVAIVVMAALLVKLRGRNGKTKK